MKVRKEGRWNGYGRKRKTKVRRDFVCSFEGANLYDIFLDSSMVEHSAVNRVVAGSSPARGVMAPWSSG